MLAHLFWRRQWERGDNHKTWDFSILKGDNELVFMGKKHACCSWGKQKCLWPWGRGISTGSACSYGFFKPRSQNLPVLTNRAKMTWRYKSWHFTIVTEKLFLIFTKAGEGRAGHNAVHGPLVSEGLPPVVKRVLSHCTWGFGAWWKVSQWSQ